MTADRDRAARRRRCALASGALAGALLVAGIAPASALTTPACLARRYKAWGARRRCERNEDAKSALGRASSRAACETTFRLAMTAIDGAATAAGIACRYRDDGDNTVTDLATGLMWLKLTGLDGAPQPFILDADDRWDWQTAIEVTAAMNGPSADGVSLLPVPGAPAYGDWRMPNMLELASLLDVTAPGCGSGAPCIDPIFGQTARVFYWTGTSDAGAGDRAATADFASGHLGGDFKQSSAHAVRAVRSAL